jgi:hypothetical protein
MQAGCEKMLPALESTLGRQRDEVESWDVAGSVATDTDVSFGSGDERGSFVLLLVRCLLNLSNCGRRHAVDLRYIEHTTRLQHADLLLLISLFILHVDLFGEDDVCGFFPSPNLGAQLHSLFVCHPMGCLVPVGDLRVPENRDVDAVVASLRGGVHGQDTACVSIRPRFYPRSNAALHSLRPGPPFAGPGQDQRSFELSQAA